LRGCYQTETRTPESLHRAEEAFAQAITKDPRYAPAYAGLASVYILLREASMMPDPEAYAKAKDAALKAMALDPDLPQAHAAMGFVTFFGDWNAAESERQFQTALRLDPDLPLAHHWYGSVLTHEGRFREGLAELDVAQRLDPSSAAILTLRAFAMGLNGRQAEGYDMLAEAVSAERPGQARNPATMHGVLATLSLLPPRNIPHYIAETTQEAEVRQDTQTVETMRLAGEVYRRRGERAMWRALLEDEKKRRPDGSPDYAMARYQAELGEKDKALDTLTELFSRHDPALIGISVDPLFASLRQDPRYERLRAAMGLPGVRET
ncbi:MAG TPA: hypothetical protein VKV02_02570, partial [Acidobacteriaceae bacterium]|nr:hypothetical protein [Acidobacteriaceae bacterium]